PAQHNPPATDSLLVVILLDYRLHGLVLGLQEGRTGPVVDGDSSHLDARAADPRVGRPTVVRRVTTRPCATGDTTSNAADTTSTGRGACSTSAGTARAGATSAGARTRATACGTARAAHAACRAAAGAPATRARCGSTAGCAGVAAA